MSLRRSLSTNTCLALTALALFWSPPARGDAFSLASVDEVERLLTAPDVKVFDANTRETFAQGHLPGAIFVDAGTLATRLPRDRTARLVFYCKNPH